MKDDRKPGPLVAKHGTRINEEAGTPVARGAREAGAERIPETGREARLKERDKEKRQQAEVEREDGR